MYTEKQIRCDLYHFSNTIFHCVSWMNKRNRKHIWTNLHINRVVLFALLGKSIGKRSILACLNNLSGYGAEAHFIGDIPDHFPISGYV